MLWRMQNTSGTALRLERPSIIFISATVIVLAIIGGVSIMFVVAYSIVAATVLSFLWTRAVARQISLTREPSLGFLAVGNTLHETFQATNNGWVPVTWMEIDDQSNFPGYPGSRVESLSSNETKTWRTEWRCRRRGRYTLGPLTLRSGDPFGFFSVEQQYPDTVSFLVYPPVVELPGLVLPRGMVAGSTSGGARALQITNTAGSVRNYQSGDSFRKIHWPTTAHRGGELYVKEYDLEKSSDLWIVLDLQATTVLGDEEESTEEYGVRVAVALANKVLRESRAVGLIAYGAEEVVIAPDKGGSQFHRILSELAAVTSNGQVPIGRVLDLIGPTLGRGATVAIITSSSDADWVRSASNLVQQGLAVVAFIIDPESFGGSVKGVTLSHEVMHAGLPCHLIRQGQEFRVISQEPRENAPGRQRVLARGYRQESVTASD